MKIMNETRFDTRALRRLATAVARGGELDPAKAARVVVKFTYSRGRHRYVTGRAIVGGIWCVIRIPRPQPGGPQEANAPMVAFVLAHEFAHLRGLAHREMGPRYRWRGAGERFAWAADAKYHIAHRGAPARKPRPTAAERLEKRRARIEELRRSWLTKARRAATALKKLERESRLIDRHMAALGKKGEDAK